MEKDSKETLIKEWKMLRAVYFGKLEENQTKFEKQYYNHPLYASVLANIDTSFRDINQIAEIEIQKILDKRQ